MVYLTYLTLCMCLSPLRIHLYVFNTLYVFITFAHTKTLYVLCAYKGDKHIQSVKHIQNTLYVFITFVCAKVINTYKVFAHTCLHHTQRLHHTQHVLITLKVTNTYLRIHVYIFAHTCIQVINTYKVYGDQHIHDAYVEPRHER